jgi:4-hydroxy-2-oxoheptanedioate aldolase
VHSGSFALKAKWASGEATFGPFVSLPAAGLVEIFAHAGFDLVVVDLEHGPINVETAENMIRAANASGIASAIRVMANQPEQISAALDLGADAVVVSHITCEADAAAAVDAARFAPAGSRGVAPFGRSASYSAAMNDGFYEDANEAVIVNVLLEGPEAIENLDPLLEMPGLDVISLAPFDLSQALGVTGQIDHPLVVQTVAEACRKAHKVICFFVGEPSAAGSWLELGVRWLTATVDAHLIYTAARRFVIELHEQASQVGGAS